MSPKTPPVSGLRLESVSSNPHHFLQGLLEQAPESYAPAPPGNLSPALSRAAMYRAERLVQKLATGLSPVLPSHQATSLRLHMPWLTWQARPIAPRTLTEASPRCRGVMRQRCLRRGWHSAQEPSIAIGRASAWFSPARSVAKVCLVG